MRGLRRCTLIVICSLVGVVALAPAARAADDYFLRIQGIPGDSTAAGLPSGPTPVDIQSFDWGATNPTVLGSATGGAGSGKTKLNDFTVTKSVDSASVPLFQHLATATQIPTMELVVRKAGAAPFIFLRYCFEHVYVTSESQSGSAGDLAETVTFLYEAAGQTYVPQNSAGLAQPPLHFAWDQVLNAMAGPFSGPGPTVCTASVVP